ncbi:MAG: hypothetical protein E7616_08570 [Ruminococcaceae bacterium]|nr:hypothetical protein [Oscillospiraceae bacterium]
MKKLLLCLILLICLPIFAGCELQDESYYEYDINEDGTLTILGVSETYSKKLTIPGTIDGKTVTAIGKYAFYRNDYIREIVLPDSVLIIEECAFADCQYLNTVVLGKNCKTIGLQAFEGCGSLTEIKLCDSLETVDDLAFNQCLHLKEFNAPASLKRIGIGAFDHCEQLIINIEHSEVAKEYATDHGIPTEFVASDGYLALKIVLGVSLVLLAIGVIGFLFKKRKKNIH